MKYVLTIICLNFSLLFAQSTIPTSTFSVNFSPMSLPGNRQTVAATASGMKFSPTPNFDLSEYTLMAPGDNLQAYLGGFDYHLPFLSKKLNNISPNLNGMRFDFYVGAAVGVDRISKPGQPVQQHYAELAHAGARYMLTEKGTWSLGAEIGYARLPGFNNNAITVALGPSFNFGH